VGRDQHVDHLPVLVDRAVDVAPGAAGKSGRRGSTPCLTNDDQPAEKLTPAEPAAQGADASIRHPQGTVSITSTPRALRRARPAERALCAWRVQRQSDRSGLIRPGVSGGAPRGGRSLST
jgi:hypothetical protein